MTILTADNFSSFTRSGDCLLLIFKNHCPYCKILMAVIEKCLLSNPDLNVAGINSEENPAILKEIDVSKVPTVLVYQEGRVSARRSGVMNPTELSALISRTKAK